MCLHPYQRVLSLFIEVAGCHYTAQLGEKLAKWPLSVRLEFKRHKNVASVPFSCGRYHHSPRWNAAWPSPGMPMARSCGLHLGGRRLCVDGCQWVLRKAFQKFISKYLCPSTMQRQVCLPCFSHCYCHCHWHEKWLRSLTGCAAKNIFNNLTHIFSHLWKHSLWRSCGRYFYQLEFIWQWVDDGMYQLSSSVFYAKHLGISICICVLMTAVLSNAKPIFDTAPAIFKISYMRYLWCKVVAASLRNMSLPSDECLGDIAEQYAMSQGEQIGSMQPKSVSLPKYLLAA